MHPGIKEARNEGIGSRNLCIKESKKQGIKESKNNESKNQGIKEAKNNESKNQGIKESKNRE